MHRHRSRTLRARIFTWFVGAIGMAILTTALVGLSTRPEAATGAEAMARNVGAHFADVWDDPVASAAYLAEIRDVTGFDVRVLRDARRLPPRVHHAASHGVAMLPENAHHIFIPVVRDGALLGAVEMEKLGVRPAHWPWWRFVLALGLAGAVLSVMASRVARSLSRPLERLAHAADRFGGGDLSFRADVSPARRWVAMEVRAVGVAFNRMADAVQAMVRGQQELLGAISHELRSPLGRARVALEIARERLPPPPEGAPSAAALDDLERQLGAVDAILGDLLDVTRAGLADVRKVKQPLVPWLRARVADEPPSPAVALEASPEAAEATPSFDAALLARAVHNLLENARAHGHPSGDALELGVEIAPATAVGRAIRVTVRDRGPGFAPGLAERAFEAFVRGDAARTRSATGGGSGLGLAIVRRVVEAHGGKVFARNAGGDGGPSGAEVGFELPFPAPAR